MSDTYDKFITYIKTILDVDFKIGVVPFLSSHDRFAYYPCENKKAAQTLKSDVRRSGIHTPYYSITVQVKNRVYYVIVIDRNSRLDKFVPKFVMDNGIFENISPQTT